MIEDKIVDALSKDGAMRPGDIATKVGAEKSDVDKAIKSLVKQDKVFSPKRCFYDVKK